MRKTKCPACSATLPADARYCTACGRPVGDLTVQQPVPPAETGPVPVSFSRIEPHWFGVTPPTFLFGVAVTAVVVAGILFAAGNVPFGLILLGIGAALLAFYVESARRRRSSVIARVTSDVRERAGSTWESVRARSVAAIELRRINGELGVVRMERRDALLALGEATHRGDKKSGGEAEKRLTELDDRETELQAELQAQIEAAGERIRQAKLAVDKTVAVPPKT